MHIVVVEDEAPIRQELTLLLEHALYEVTALTSFHDVGAAVLREAPDLVLLDLNLPEESGFDVCRKIRASSEVPVIFLTSRTDTMDELSGMLLGGDDYVTKPFAPPVLLARIAAVLKRTKGAQEKGPQKLVHRDVTLDMARGCVCHAGLQAEMTRNELKILYFLFTHPDRIVSRTELIEYLWDNRIFIDDKTLSVNMTRIRAKLASVGVPDLIATKRGMGYYM